MSPVVAVLEPFDAAMQAKVREIVGDGLTLVFPKSAELSDLIEAVQQAEFAVVRAIKMPASLLDHARQLRAIHQWGTGTDGLPIAAAKARGILLARSPGKNAPSVADLTLGLMLATLRRIVVADQRIRAGLWLEPNIYDIGRDLTGSCVGLVGFGAIGQAVAKRLAGFDCTVLYTRASGPLQGAAFEFVALEDMLDRCDIISLHLPLTDTTRHIFDRAKLGRMRKGAVLINTSRGGLVDQIALGDLLEIGHLGGAGIDAFDSEPMPIEAPLRQAPNTVFTPHCGGGTRDNLIRIVRHWSENLHKIAAGRPLDPLDVV
jgi:phosphoglycerate dehydrogenase-like enzyme